MKEECKYTGTELAKALKLSYYKRRGINHKFTYDDIMTLALAWSDHPRFPSPRESTIYARERKDGELWIKKSEIPSFESYIGFELLNYLG